MSSSRDFVTTVEAARILGVTVQHVRRLADRGDLSRVARGLIDATSVDRYLAVSGPGARTRAWAEHTAWGAIALLCDVYPDWLGPVQASRLRAALRETTRPSDLVARTRDRAQVHVFSGHPTAARRLLHDMVTTDGSDLGLITAVALSGTGVLSPLEGVSNRVDGYYPAAQLDSTSRFLGLVVDPNGTITVRATSFDMAVIRDLAGAQVPVLAALDIAASLDPRERGVGERALADALERFSR